MLVEILAQIHAKRQLEADFSLEMINQGIGQSHGSSINQKGIDKEINQSSIQNR